MTDMNVDQQIIKSDGIGRLRTPRARQEQLLDEFERSGLSGPQFAALVGVKYQTFANWAQRRRRQLKSTSESKTPADSATPVHWLEAVVEKAGASTGATQSVLIIDLPGGARMQIGSPAGAALAAHLLRLLEGKPHAPC